MRSRILELFTIPTDQHDVDWQTIVADQYCPYLDRTCVKIRKSQPEIAIGTCSIYHGVKNSRGVIICPYRLLERKQIFTDCLHLLTLHEPGNELHRLSEIVVPGGSVDYVIASVRNGTVVDFVGLELQALDTTGTLWPQRQQFLKSVGVEVSGDLPLKKAYGINWKMTAKTTLVQLHHKIRTFENLNKHLVLVLQESLLNYMRQEFSFEHVHSARIGDPMHSHVYALQEIDNQLRLNMISRFSTDANGIALCLGLQISPGIELEAILSRLQARISEKTLLTVL